MRERAARKEKRPPREAQLDIFTKKVEHPIQPGLFQDFVKKSAQADEKTAAPIPEKEGLGIQNAGMRVETRPTGRILEAPSAVVKDASEGKHAIKKLEEKYADKQQGIFRAKDTGRGGEVNRVGVASERVEPTPKAGTEVV